MLIIIPLFIFVNILAIIKSMMKKRYKISLILITPLIICLITYLYIFTLVPVKIGITKIPNIEIVKIGSINEFKHLNIKYLDGDGAMIISSNKNLDEYVIILFAMRYSGFKYEDIHVEKNDNTILESNCSYFLEKCNDKYLYIIPFSISDSIVTDKNIYCKIFLVRMLRPTYQTEEMKISFDSLRRSINF